MSMQPDNTYDPLAWGSHFPALLAAVGASTGPVLELGVGHFSTPALHCLVLGMGRTLVSIEDHKEWFEEFSVYGKRDNRHKLIWSDYDDAFHKNVSIIGTKHWGVVFMGGERGARDFDAFLGVADFVVVHDYEKENEQMIRPMLIGVKAFVTTRYSPPTLIASLHKRIPDCVTDL